MKFFIGYIGTSVTITTSSQIDTKSTVTTVMAIGQGKTMRQFRSNDTVITVLRFAERSFTIDTVLHIRERLVTIVTFSHSPCTTDEIAVLRIPTIISVFTVLTRKSIIIHSSWMRHRLGKSLELLKKRFRKIKIPSIIERVPGISPP